ncbi:MAG: hypothetical protein Q7O66_09630 [Dehalococcoidia bacterium]|nr:hypothetical protein [Dehalococcoidia bacterium]
MAIGTLVDPEYAADRRDQVPASHYNAVRHMENVYMGTKYRDGVEIAPGSPGG